MSLKDNNGADPRFEELKSFIVEKNEMVRKFKVDGITEQADTLVLSLCWNRYQNLNENL